MLRAYFDFDIGCCINSGLMAALSIGGSINATTSADRWRHRAVFLRTCPAVGPMLWTCDALASRLSEIYAGGCTRAGVAVNTLAPATVSGDRGSGKAFCIHTSEIIGHSV
jgi:hypothetical protein